MWAYFATTRLKLISRKEYGTAEWASEKDISNLFACNLVKEEIKKIKASRVSAEVKEEKIKAARDKYEDADMLFTDTERICMYNFQLNNNTLIIGGSGSGKTRGFVMPNILQAHSSYVVTDPKGEILSKAGYFLEHVKGYKVRVLNLDEKELSSGYNPLKYIDRSRSGWEERVLSLIETVIINTDGGEKKGSSDPFWDKAERLFLQSIIFAVVQGFPPEESNMNTVMMLIRWLKLEEDGDTYNSDLDKFFRCFEEKYGEDHIAVDQFKEFREKASGKTAKSIVISAVARLAPFKVKEVKRIFSHDEMHLDRVGEEKTAVFVIVPPTDKTYNFIAGILFTQLFQELNYCALNVHKNDGQRLPVSCRFILDEFSNTCTIPNFVSILAYARSLGIGIVTILQSLEQIKNMYKDEWGVIVDNSNTLLYLGKVTHMETLKYLSELLGKATFDKTSSSRSRGRQGSSSINRDRIGRELLDPSEIRKMPNDKCLLFVGGKNPFYSTKYKYENHKNYRFSSDGDKTNIYTYMPLPPQKAEQKRPHREDKITVKPEEELFAVIEAEREHEKSILETIKTETVELKTDTKSVVEGAKQLIEKEIANPGSIDFNSYEVADGEHSVSEEYKAEEYDMDEIEETEYEELPDLVDVLNDLSEFERTLDEVDTSNLPNPQDEELVKEAV